MKPITLSLLVVALVVGGGTVLPLFAAPPESEELDLPEIAPRALNADQPTFVTFTSNPSDSDVKKPKLQYFDADKGKWKTIKSMSDKGKAEDPVKKDGEYNLRLLLADSSGRTAISLPPKKAGKPAKQKADQQTPVQFRLAAKKKGLKGIVTSPPFVVPTVQPTPVALQGEQGPAAAVQVPATFDVVDDEDPSWVVLIKRGPDGYDLVARTEENASGLPLEEWIISCFLLSLGGPCVPIGPSDPQTLAAYDFEGRGEGASISALNAGGLSGIRLDLHTPESSAIHVFLDDPGNSRVFHFSLFENKPFLQGQFFADNLVEALSVVQSLQP